eukprot:gene17499-biopygen11083
MGIVSGPERFRGTNTCSILPRIALSGIEPSSLSESGSTSPRFPVCAISVGWEEDARRRRHIRDEVQRGGLVQPQRHRPAAGRGRRRRRVRESEQVLVVRGIEDAASDPKPRTIYSKTH